MADSDFGVMGNILFCFLHSFLVRTVISYDDFKIFLRLHAESIQNQIEPFEMIIDGDDYGDFGRCIGLIHN